MVARFGSLAEAEGAYAYLRTVMARAYEEAGQRERAVTLLTKAAAPTRVPATGDVDPVLDIGIDEVLGVDQSLRQAGRQRDADLLAVAFAAEHPQDLRSARHLANVRARNCKWGESARLLEWIGARSGGRDPALLVDLAFALLNDGRRSEAARTASKAARLQPASPIVREIVRLAAFSRD